MSRALLQVFDAVFQRRDGETMAACYHPEARFSDPVFVDLTSDEPGWMWRMLCRRGRDLQVTYRDIEEYGLEGSAH